MLLSNCRIEKNKDIAFYEQDILIDNNTYSGNIDIHLKAEYVTPGIGIALIVDEGLSLNEMAEIYLYKIGYNSFSLVRKKDGKNENIDTGPLINTKPYIENLYIRFVKDNNKLSFYINNELLSSKYLPTEINNFNIGYYSNAGNKIKSISIASDIPSGWNVNMDNTNGGYIKFENNKFSITNCSDLAEIEQNKITLKSNDDINRFYYLKYDKEYIDNENDIKAYVFLAEDDRYNANEKNILNKDSKFTLKKDQDVSLRFTGTIGSIKNIQITNSIDDLYVETDYEIKTENGSYLKIKTNDLTKIEFSGVIYNIPKKENIFDKDSYAIIEDNSKQYTIDDFNLNLNNDNRNDFVIDIENNNTLTIKNNNEIKSYALDIKNYIYAFKNIDAKIDKIILHKKDKSINNILVQNTKKVYVPTIITSPIAVTNEDETPLNLSSSYRRYVKDDVTKYIFTNVEREIFEATNKLVLNNKISENIDSIIVYCISNNATINDNELYTIKDDNINSISSYCNSYTKYIEKDLYYIDKESGIILIDENGDKNISSRYKKIVVDYLKKDNYCINYKHDLGSYEVDISCNNKTKIIYDGAAEKNALVSINDYKIIEAEIQNANYIVLKGR